MRDTAGKNIHLDCNENPWGMSAGALSALSKVTANSYRYPRGVNLNTLQEKIAHYVGAEPHQIILGNGSYKIFFLIAALFKKPKAEFLFPEHSFMAYPFMADLLGVKKKVVPLNHWQVDLAALKASISAETSIIFLANPNNPVGFWIDHQSLSHFLEQVPNHIMVVVDEAYYEYARYNLKEQYTSAVSLQNKHPNLIITRTFSKVFGLAGFRIGYGVFSSKIASTIRKMDFPYSLTDIALTAASVVIDDKAYVQHCLENNSAEMNKMLVSLQAKGFTCLASPANFFLLNLSKGVAPTLFRDLSKHGIFVSPLSEYQLPHCLRVSIGTPADNESFRKVLFSLL